MVGRSGSARQVFDSDAESGFDGQVQGVSATRKFLSIGFILLGLAFVCIGTGGALGAFDARARSDSLASALTDQPLEPEKPFLDVSAASAKAPKKRYSGAPGSTGELEDAAAALAAEHSEEVRAQDRQSPKLYWMPLASNEVVDDEGGSVQATGGTIWGAEACGRACEASEACRSFTLCGGKCYMKTKVITSTTPHHHNSYCTSYYQTADTYRPSVAALAQPSNAAEYTFYVYRSQGPPGPKGDYPLENVNVASIGGVMWYLHDEVIKDCWYDNKAGQRRFGISRIRRFKITYKPTQPLKDRGSNFGVLLSFDSGKATGPWPKGETYDWDNFGYEVGCGNLGQFPHTEWVFQSGKKYPDAIWYSLPGPCPTESYKEATSACKRERPGGMCSRPDGRGNCTYHVEEAGEIDIDELVGITPKWRDRADFCRRGGFEGDGATNSYGNWVRFWDNIWDTSKNHWRVQQAIDAFNRKYPHMAKVEDLPPPKCDFNYNRYYWNK